MRFDPDQDASEANQPEDERPQPPEELVRQDINLDLQLKLDVPDMEFEVNPRLDSGLLISAEKLKGMYYELGEVDTRPLPLYRAHPIYPPRADQLGIEGSVEVEFIINAAGRAERIRIVRATPAGYFENSVVKAVESSKFKPAVLDGEPVAVKVVTTYGFNKN